MTKKERKQEQAEIAAAVKTLMAACRAMANRKAEQYERDFLIQCRDAINREIDVRDFVTDHTAEMIGSEVAKQITPNAEHPASF